MEAATWQKITLFHTHTFIQYPAAALERFLTFCIYVERQIEQPQKHPVGVIFVLHYMFAMALRNKSGKTTQLRTPGSGSEFKRWERDMGK